MSQNEITPWTLSDAMMFRLQGNIQCNVLIKIKLQNNKTRGASKVSKARWSALKRAAINQCVDVISTETGRQGRTYLNILKSTYTLLDKENDSRRLSSRTLT